MWNNAKILKNSWVNNICSNVKENLLTEDRIREAMDKISPAFCVTDPSHLPTCSDTNFFKIPFNFTELNIALDSKNAKSSPGIDGIDNNILKNLPIRLKLILLDIFNDLYETGIPG